MPPHPPEMWDVGRAQARSDAVAARSEVPALWAELDYNRDELTIARTEVNGLRRELMTALQVPARRSPLAWTCLVAPACRSVLGLRRAATFPRGSTAAEWHRYGIWHARGRLTAIVAVGRCGVHYRS